MTGKPFVIGSATLGLASKTVRLRGSGVKWHRSSTHSIGFGSFCDRRHADEEEQPVLVHLTVKAGAQDEKEWVPSKCSSGSDSLSQWARPHQARPV